MRRVMLVLTVVLTWPGAATALQPTAKRPYLILKAPKATTYLHRIEFVGRLVPSRPGIRIRLMRGTTLVTATRIRGDGTFRIPVKLVSPGPFHVEGGRVRSANVAIRIRPRLEAKLIGSRVAGRPLHLVARLRPRAAGAVHIQVIRHGKIDFDGRYGGEARIKVGTRRPETVRVQVRAVPKPGYLALSQRLEAVLRPPALELGSTSVAVAEAARRLKDLGYAVPEISTVFSDDFLQSVYAFQKVQGLERSGIVDAAFWAKLESPRVPQPRYREPAAHIEIDKSRQVLYLVRDREVALISSVSTAGIAGYYTPEGRFTISRKVGGYDPSPLGVLLNPMYFVGGYAIHGSPSVPPYPASHGCVRVPNFVIYRLFSSEPYGETVYVYS